MFEYTRPYRFQYEDVIQIEKWNGRGLLCNDMGLGKTYESLLWRKLFNEEGLTVIVSPSPVKLGWQWECRLHFDWNSQILESQTVDRYPEHIRSNDILIINYEILEYWLDFLVSLKPSLVILDEIQYIRNPEAIRAKACKELTKNVPHIIGLSGTPISNRPFEFYSILSILDPDTWNSPFSFGYEYCQAKRRNGQWEYKGAENLDKLNRILLENYMVRRRKIDVLKDLPSKTRSIVPIRLDRSPVYQEALEELLKWLGKWYGHGDKKLERIARMGHVKRLIADLKMPFVIDWIENFLSNTTEKLILFGIHKKLLNLLREKYPSNSVLVNGEVTGVKRQRQVDLFISDPKIDLFLGNIDAAGVGVDGLQTVCQNVAFFEMAWTSAQHDQAEDRAWRLKQNNAVMCYYLLCLNTMEEDTFRLQQSKRGVLDAIIDGITFNSESGKLIDDLEKILLERGAA